MDVKKEIIDEIIRVEGGYVNNPNDSGGETNWGITKAVARANGYNGNIAAMPRSAAASIYCDKYWDINNLDDILLLSERIAKEIADTGVNMGVGRAAKFLQLALNALNGNGTLYSDIVADNVIGQKTINALRAFLEKRSKDGESVMLKMLNCMQGSFYISLAARREKDEAFIFGWFKNRVNI